MEQDGSYVRVLRMFVRVCLLPARISPYPNSHQQ